MAGLASGSLASLVRAAATSSTTIALPLVLAALLEKSSYSEWALVFAIASLVLYLDLGLPTSIQVLTSRAVSGPEPRPGKARDAAKAALTIAAGAAIVALAASCVFAAFFPRLYPHVPTDDSAGVVVCLLELVIAQGANLISNVASGYFIGVERNWSMTAVVAPTRVAAAVACCVVAATDGTLPALGLAYLAPTASGAVILVVRILRIPPGREPFRGQLAEMARFTAPLIVWGLMMSVITGLDLIVVARVDYEAVRAYSIAAALTAGVVGMSSAALGPLLAHITRRLEEEDPAGVRSTVVRWGSFAGLLAGAGFAASMLLVALRGQWSEAGPFLAYLALGMTLRVAITPVSSAAVAAGRASRLTVGAVGEAVVNLGCSITLGIMFGAAGVAAGTTIAALGACLYTSWAATRVVPALAPARRAIVSRVFLVPGVAIAPIAVASIVEDGAALSPALAIAFGCSAVLLGLLALPLVRGRYH